MKFILIYTTHASLGEAKKIVQPLLESRVVACVNYFPIISSYHWNGGIETTEEMVAILKTRLENWGVVRTAILDLHPYETPCVIRLAEVEANDSYAAWIQSETAGS